MLPEVPIEKAAIPGPTDPLDLDRDQLQSILQHIPTGIMVAQASSGAVVFVSEHANRLLGRSTSEISACPERGSLHPDGQPYTPDEFPLVRSITKGETVRDTEIVYERPDGERLALRVDSMPVYDAEGRISAGVLIVTNVTDHRRFQRVARRSQHELLDFFENAVEGLHWAGPDGTLLWANQAELDLLGYAPEEYLGHNLAEFHTDPNAVEEILTRLKRNETLREHEASVRCKDGSIKHVLINANVLWFEGQFIHTRCFTRDITERKLLEQQLERRVEELAEADRRKDEFLALLGHELRNPLAAVSAAAELMQARGTDPASVQRTSELISRQVRQMARLTDDLLDVARINYGRIDLRKERVHLAAIVGRAIETVRPLLEGSRQELRVSLCPENVLLLADAARLEQVLVNLLANASKYSDIGSEVQLEVECLDTTAMLRVRDSGVGISADMLGRIFEPFTRLTSVGEDERGGLGLGLTLVKKLVDLHGGSVEAFSKGPGRGSEFVVRLPVQDVGRPGTRAAGGSEVGPGPSVSDTGPPLPGTRRVLLVDDNVDAAVTLGEILGILGHDVCVAHSGPEALEMALQHRPDVVLLDIGMPRMDGYEVARRLRAMGSLDSALLVAMTGFGQDRDRQRSLEEGFHHHLVKPVEVEAIMALLNGKST
jgi:PAS domain S-box-containing protein